MHVVIVDDHKLFADALKNVLPAYRHFDSIKVVRTSSKLLTLLEYEPIDVVLLDITLKDGMNGFETLQELKRRKPEVKVIIISMHTQKEYVNRARELRADAYVFKDLGADELENAFSHIYRKGGFYCNEIEREENPFDVLTKTERKVVAQIASGLTSQEVADKLFKSRHTIDTHRKNIYRKLDVNHVSELTKMASKWLIMDDLDQQKSPGH